MNTKLFSEVDNYISNLLAVEDEILKSILASINENGIPSISITPSQGKFLQVLMAACNAKNVLELGTLGGYSTIWMARALPNNGKIITVDNNAKHTELARQNIAYAKLTSKVEFRTGKALDILHSMVNEKKEPFDFIFIDADKPPYTEYFQCALKLSRSGTIIVCDNVIREGGILDENSEDENVKGVQRFNKYLSENSNVAATIIQSVGAKGFDGMAVAVVR